MTTAGRRGVVALAVSVVGAIVVGLISMVVAAQSRITAVEVRVEAVKEVMDIFRRENSSAHDRILDEIKEINRK